MCKIQIAETSLLGSNTHYIQSSHILQYLYICLTIMTPVNENGGRTQKRKQKRKARVNKTNSPTDTDWLKHKTIICRNQSWVLAVLPLVHFPVLKGHDFSEDVFYQPSVNILWGQHFPLVLLINHLKWFSMLITFTHIGVQRWLKLIISTTWRPQSYFCFDQGSKSVKFC